MLRMMELAADTAFQNWIKAKQERIDGDSGNTYLYRLEKERWKELEDIYYLHMAWETAEVPFQPDPSMFWKMIEKTVVEHMDLY